LAPAERFYFRTDSSRSNRLNYARKTRQLEHCRRKAIHSADFHQLFAYLKILLLRSKRGPQVWQFRWSEISPGGKRLYHKKIVGTVEQYPDTAVRRAVVGLLSEIKHRRRANEFRRDDRCSTQRSFRAARTREGKHLARSRYQDSYKAYLSRWIRPQ
jgi:hypothetical protein